MRGKPSFCQMKEVQVFNYVRGRFQYTATLRRISLLRPVYTTKIMRIECELIRINCVHTEFALSQF